MTCTLRITGRKKTKSKFHKLDTIKPELFHMWVHFVSYVTIYYPHFSVWVTRNSSDLQLWEIPWNGLREIPWICCRHFHRIFLWKIPGNFRGFTEKLLPGFPGYNILYTHTVFPRPKIEFPPKYCWFKKKIQG